MTLLLASFTVTDFHHREIIDGTRLGIFDAACALHAYRKQRDVSDRQFTIYADRQGIAAEIASQDMFEDQKHSHCAITRTIAMQGNQKSYLKSVPR